MDSGTLLDLRRRRSRGLHRGWLLLRLRNPRALFAPRVPYYHLDRFHRRQRRSQHHQSQVRADSNLPFTVLSSCDFPGSDLNVSAHCSNSARLNCWPRGQSGC